jgi:predicted RNase H-like HicB family nuclease
VIPYRLAIEDIEPQRFVAWALDLPGCFGRGPTAAEALDAAPGAILAYFAWVAEHDPAAPRPGAAIETRLVESHAARPSAERPGYLVNALFDDDRRALGFWDAAVALRVLEWSREDLLRLLASFPAESLQRLAPRQGPRSIAEVVEHAAGAENWYLDRKSVV